MIHNNNNIIIQFVGIEGSCMNDTLLCCCCGCCQMVRELREVRGT